MAGLLERMQSNDAISEEELPDYDAIGALGPPPEYKNTDSAAGYVNQYHLVLHVLVHSLRELKWCCTNIL